MKATKAPVMVILAIFGLGAALLPSRAQLPATNMGKFIHQPGDNQYSDATQQSRHGAPPPPRQFRQVAVTPGYRPAPAPKKPDITLEPIAADEPIPLAGFPPMPDRLELPIAGGMSSGIGRGFGNVDSGGGGGGGGGGNFGGPAPGMAGGGGGAPAAPTYHQHYGHVAPGAFQKPSGGQGYYKATTPGQPAGGGGGQGYYKARTPPPASQQSDYYNANTGGSPGMAPPRYTGATPRDLKQLGKEPKLNDRNEEQMAPDAPVPVVVSQSTTQDLSLPEDEFTFRHPSKSKGGKNPLGKMLKGPLNSVGGITGVRF